VAVGYRRPAGPAPAEDIERLEQRVGRPLPGSYKDFLRRQDGGQLQDNNEAVNEIFGVGPDAPDWANMWKKLDTYAGRLPTWLLPVASDGAGNLFALSLRDRDKGSVWFWDHEREADEDEPPADDNIAQRAADWRGFLESLQPPNLDGYDMDDIEIE
jgi:hypothetical protein